MFFRACEQLAEQRRDLEPLVARLDERLSRAPATSVLRAEELASVLRENEPRVRSVLELLSDGGVFQKQTMTVCDCGTLNALGLGQCTQCGRELSRDAPRSIAFRFTDSAQERLRAAPPAAEAMSLAEDVVTDPGPTVGVVTALPKEFVAMKKMLDEPWPHVVSGRGAGRQYELGYAPALQSGRRHLVALALLPDIGNNLAAAITTNLLHHFHGVVHIIMCGIAGGIPGADVPSDYVRLGDVVTSDRGGVVQYDFVKESKTIEARHPPRPPSAEILHAARMLEAAELEGKRPWEDHFARADALEKARRPSEANGADGRPIEYPDDRTRRSGLPRVFNGPIGSSNTLLKSEIKRDALRAKFRTRAIEMEGAGLADGAWLANAGYFIVRGICDYCDERKGDVWQDYAAVAAATYVRALLASMGA